MSARNPIFNGMVTVFILLVVTAGAVSAQDAPAPAAVQAAPPVAEGERVKASPLARRLAEEAGLDLARVPGSGPGGRVGGLDGRRRNRRSRCCIRCREYRTLGERLCSQALMWRATAGLAMPSVTRPRM